MTKGNSWGRMVLAFTAVMVVACAGLSFAVSNGASYARPKLAIIQGPGTVAPNSVATTYTLFVTYVDGTSGVATSGVNWTASAGTMTNGVSGSGDYNAPGSTGKALLTASYSSGGATVTANRAILISN